MRGTITVGCRTRWLVGLTGVLAGAMLFAVAGPAPAEAGTQTIKMKQSKRDLWFEGPPAVRSGANLRIVNRTNPNRVGPHTFSLVQGRLLPRTRNQFQRCFTPGRICFGIAEAHELDFETEEVNRPLVEVGRDGWDRSFTSERDGDSWYTGTRDEAITQQVSAGSGRTLRFICAVHPFMQGKIEVR